MEGETDVALVTVGCVKTLPFFAGRRLPSRQTFVPRLIINTAMKKTCRRFQTE